MKFLNVLKSFKLNLAEGVIRDFEAGLHEVEDEIAAHWYVAANSEPLTAKQAKAIKASDEVADTGGDTQAPDAPNEDSDTATVPTSADSATDAPPAS